MLSFVLGNGNSRKEFNVKHYKQYGNIYGCNAIYRDELVDYLVAVDPPMVQEIIDNKAHLLTKFYTREHRRFTEIPNINIIPKRLGWSSGPTALWLASHNKSSSICLVGFDFQSNINTINNIYSGTKNYKPTESPATYFGNWIKQVQLTVRDNPNINYYRLITKEHRFTPPELLRYPNFSNITYEKLLEKFKMARFEPISE
jgi:hypothetical protein